MVGRKRVGPLEELQRVGLVAAEGEIGHLPHRLDMVGFQLKTAIEGVHGVLVAARVVE